MRQILKQYSVDVLFVEVSVDWSDVSLDWSEVYLRGSFIVMYQTNESEVCSDGVPRRYDHMIIWSSDLVII